MVADRPFLGVMLMLGFCILAPLGDSIAKYLGDTIPLAELLLVRFLAQGILLLPFALSNGGFGGIRGRIFWMTVLRTVLHIIGIAAMFTSLRFLPLADALAIAFVMPFFMLILGKAVLKEEVGARRLIASFVGFLGTLMVIQPSFAVVGLPALLPLVVAVFFAGFVLVTRNIAKEVEPMALQAASGWIAVPILAACILAGYQSGGFAFGLVMPQGIEIWLLALIGVIGTVAHLLMTWSLRFAPSTTLAPMQYLEIPFATIIGYVVFKDLPNGMAAVGILITIAAGVYVILREHHQSRQIPPEV